MSLTPDDKSPPPQLPEVVEITSWGIRVFPGLIDGKTPVLARWPELATTDSVITSGWWAKRPFNICMVMGRITSGPLAGKYLVGFDYDMKPGQRGGEALLAHDLNGWGNTLTNHTASGGVHKIYWSNEPIANSTGRVAPNVDVRGERGYLIAATSVVGGKPYWREGGYGDIKEIPAGLAKLAGKGRKSKANGAAGANGAAIEHSKAPVGDQDTPAAVERAKQYLINEAPEAIQGNHGDQTTFMVAARCKDLGVSEAETVQLMLAWWNDEKAVPPWAPDELATKVANAFKYGALPPGAADPANEFERVQDAAPNVVKSEGDIPQDPTPDTKLLDARGRAPMVDETFDEAADAALNNQSDPLIEGIMGQGEMTGVYGNPESGKTFTVLDLCHAVASGALTWNGRRVTQGAVMYVVAEGSKKIRARIRALQARYGTAGIPFRLLIYPMDMRTGRLDADRLSALIAQRAKEMGQPVRLVALDTLTNMLAGGNDVEHMNQFLSNAQIVQVKTGANVLVIHHPGKDTSKGPRGSSVFRGWVDTLIEVHDPSRKKGGRRRFEVLRVRDEELPANPFWFRVDGVDLGTTPNGSKLTSATVTWLDSAEEDFRTEMTPADKALFETIGRWAEATGNQPPDVTANTLLDWVGEHEHDNPIGQTKPGTMRMQLLRLREQGCWG